MIRGIHYFITELKTKIDVIPRGCFNEGSGPDDIPLKELRECADELAPSLTTLFNLSTSTCTLPEEWRYSNVVPIHKKGKKGKVDN